MTELHEPPVGGWDVAEPGHGHGNGGDPTSTPSTLLDKLRAKRAAQSGEHFYDLEVPGYDGLLVLRLAPLRGQEVSQLARRAESSRSPDKEFNANADMLIRGCREVLGRESREQPLRSIDPEGGRAGLNELAELFGIQAASARELLRELWDKVPSPEISIGLMAAEYVQWSSEANRQTDEDFVGESPAAPS